MSNRDRGLPDVASDDRYELQQRYLDLVRVELPHAARTSEGGRWCVIEDHCFMRIILDHLFNACWYEHLDKRLAAYKQLDNRQLTEAIRLAERMLRDGPRVAESMNLQSLRWRGRITTF